MLDASTMFDEMKLAYFYDLTIPIEQNIGCYSKEEAMAARDIAVQEVGEDVIREKNPELLLMYYENEPLEYMVVYVIFDKAAAEKDTRYASRRLFIMNNKIIHIRYD